MPSAERKLIADLRNLALTANTPAVVRGIGDDAAVLRPSPNSDLLVTTDLCIENVHFRQAWHPARCVGHRCLVRGLSDIAAMGGDPTAAFLSLGLPARLPQKWVTEFLRGLLDLARIFKVQLAGGDIASAPAITADIIVLGSVPRGKAVLRSGACPGDRIFVTGELGSPAATLKCLFAGEQVRPTRGIRHFYPTPRLQVARWLRQRSLASSMIDISDGLSVDLAHICEESRVAATIHSSAIPIARDANLQLALHGGDEYELLFTVAPRKRVPPKIAGVKVTEIGVIERKKNYSAAIRILDDNGKARPLQPAGWQHFGKSS